MLSLLALTCLAQSAEIPLVSGLGISGVSQGGRSPAPIDTIQSLIVEGKWTEPHAGDKIAGVRGAERTWEPAKANKDGVFEGGATSGGYIDMGADADAEKPMLLRASGDTMVYINGIPRAGDPYSYGYLKLPFLLKKGHNEFLFACGRGRLQAKLMAPEAPQTLNTGDLTLPDILVGEKKDLSGAIPIINSEEKAVTDLSVGAIVDDGHEVRTNLPRIEPMTLRKCGFNISCGDHPPGDFPLKLKLYRGNRLMHEAATTIRVRKPTEHYKRTFVSRIDGSVQYYAVCPALKPSKNNALILTVHGASVEAIGQAAAYAPKDWCTIVAPTNRRPYGFDWEDWGRMDAMEVWDIAKHEFPHDPKRVILTGHSMGGHGTWTLGLTYPNEFAAIGPSAGWVSFWSYAGGWTPQDPNPVEKILRRSMNSSDTLLMLKNAKMEDVFILHGDKDDNVPVEQARTMKAKLTDIGAKFEYHEEPGAGHWWGNQCVDWPPMFEMFDHARLPDAAGIVSTKRKWVFSTVNPGVSATYDGVTIEQQIDPLQPSEIRVETEDSLWGITTKNVRRFRIERAKGSYPASMDIDGNLMWDSSVPGPLDFETAKGGWRYRVDSLDKNQKWAGRTGPFKLAFQNRMMFVVGTHGSAEENGWSANKARFDAESWYYRGNGAVDIFRDDEVGRYRDRNLILYGNADTNCAFKLIANSPVQFKRGCVSIGGHRMSGEDHAAIYLYPQGSRMIAAIGGTGLPGCRYTDRLPYFTSGVAYPDWTILNTSILIKGSKAVPAAGFFDNAWKFDPRNTG